MAAPQTAAAARPAVEAKDLSLKGAPRARCPTLTPAVMRLNKPALYLTVEPRCEAQEMLGADADIEDMVGLSRAFSLPLQFGSIHTGETFASYISLCNISSVSLSSVVMRVELQLQGGTTKHLLLDNSESPMTAFAPAASADFVVRHVLKEAGACMLVCAVSYMHPDGEKRFFRKFFKFPVSPPFEVTLQTRPLGADVAAEVQVRNITAGAVFIDSIKLDTAAGAFTATEVPVSAPESTLSVTAPGAPPIDDLLVLKPGASRQMLYRLRQKVPDARNATQVGTVAVTWRAALGESASFVSDVLERKAVSRDEVELIVRRVPPTVRIEEPFAVEVELVNRSDRSLNGRLHIPSARNASIQPHGSITQTITLPPQGTRSVQLSLFALRAGLHKVPLQVQDATAERKYDFANALTVNVTVSV